MAVDRHHWQERLTKFRAPRWRCPKCDQGHFVLLVKSVHVAFSADSRAHLSEYPEDRGENLDLRFSAIVKCDNRECEETAAIGGTGQESMQDDCGDRSLYVELEPKFVIPSPNIFSIPRATPKNLVDEIQTAFSLSWSEFESCLTKIRHCLELLLDNLKVPRFSKKPGKSLGRLTLPRRIELLSNPLVPKKYLTAMKYLGDGGTHSRGAKATRNDVFDALELLEHVLKAYYGEGNRIETLATRIVRKSGKRTK